MSHMVMFRSGEGKAGYHQAEDLDDAIRFVERLRNSENVEQARIFRMEEVGFEYRPYFRVEVAGSASSSAAPGAPADADAGTPARVHAGGPSDELHGDDVGAARRGIFSR